MALSVARKQVPREGVFRSDPAEIIWVLGLKDRVSFAMEFSFNLWEAAKGYTHSL